MSWFFLIHPILQKILKSFLSNWERHRYQGERSPGICGMYVVMLFLLLSFSLKGQLWMFEIPQMLMYVYVSVFDSSAVDLLPASYGGLFKQMCLAPEKQVFSPFFLCIYHHWIFQNFKKVVSNSKGRSWSFTASSMRLLSEPVQCQLFTVTVVKTESQTFSGRWLFSSSFLLLVLGCDVNSGFGGHKLLEKK